MNNRTDIVSRNSSVNARKIDVENNITNPWRWEWLAKKVNGSYLQECVRKISRPGVAYCTVCSKELYYKSRGCAALTDHVKSNKHKEAVELRNNYSLPGSSQTTDQDSCYGLHPMYASTDISTETHIPKPLTPLVDRVANNEAMLLSFLAEKSLPFSLAPDLIQLIKGMSDDKKALNRLAMHRTSASYKLKFGVAKTIEENVIQDLKKEKFSLNIDESMSNNNEKVVAILVNYLRNDKIVTEHIKSFSITNVNSASLFKSIVSLLDSNAIPWHNLMSVLLDSCNVMRGKKSGLELRLREKCPHLLDIDGDSCHHAHNAAKRFCKPFNLHLESLCSDIHNDFKWSPDLRSALKEMCDVLNVKYTVPVNYVSFRWLSIYDVAQDFSRLFSVFILFYFSFLEHSEQTVFLHVVIKIYKDLNVNKAGRDSIRKLQNELAAKHLTAAGKERKSRITRKLFVMNLKTKLIMHLYVSVLPLLKEYVKLFQSNVPLIHKLHDKQIELLRDFLACFMKPEVLRCFGESANNVKGLDVKDKNNHLPMKSIFVGDKVKELFACAHKSSEEVMSFKKLVVEAYIACSQTLLSKMPIENPLLRSVSAIDPVCRQHYLSLKLMKELPLLVQNVLLPQEKDSFNLEVHRYHSDTALNLPDAKEPIVKWWIERKESYPLLSKMAFALLTCFHGPKVEGSFSIMNNVITAGSSRLNISTFNALQTVKYHLLAEGKSSVDYFKKVDFLQEPVESKLVKNLRSASKAYEAEKSERRKAKIEKLKNIQDLKKKSLSKERAKKICSNAAKQQRLKHLKKVNQIKLSEKVNLNISVPEAHFSLELTDLKEKVEPNQENSKNPKHVTERPQSKKRKLEETVEPDQENSKNLKQVCNVTEGPQSKKRRLEETDEPNQENSKKPKRIVCNVTERPQSKKRKTNSFNIKEMFERAILKKTGT